MLDNRTPLRLNVNVGQTKSGKNASLCAAVAAAVVALDRDDPSFIISNLFMLIEFPASNQIK